MQFETVIGLEVHVQLNTKTKLFCSCATNFGEKENQNTCPVCLGLPGALPVPNKEAIKKAIYLGKAIGATINERCFFDRKNYFYPDLPLGYQISQLPKPIVENGIINIQTPNGDKTINVLRAHLETDAGKNIHENAYSKVDLNRAGIPLIEIVSAPDLSSSDEAVSYLKKLHAIVRFLDISDANMQEGSFRCDANVSIRPKGDTNLYTRVEIKNINSFKFIQKAIDLEVSRQSMAWEDGYYDKEVRQETRLYDSVKNETRSMRGKEESADYRYFPDPDLLDVVIDDELKKELKPIPELPDEKKARYKNELNLSEQDASFLTTSLDLALFFEDLIKAGCDSKNAVSWLCVELLARLNKLDLELSNSPVKPQDLAELIFKIQDKTINANGAKEALDFMLEHKTNALDAISKLGLKQVSDDNIIEKIVNDVLENNQEAVQRYKNGEEKLFGFFVGQAMKQSKGQANPANVNKLLSQKLKA